MKRKIVITKTVQEIDPSGDFKSKGIFEECNMELYPDI